MQFTNEHDSDSFLAIMASLFTFCFMFLGLRMHPIYYVIGFVCLGVAIVYWVKVKKGETDE